MFSYNEDKITIKTTVATVAYSPTTPLRCGIFYVKILKKGLPYTTTKKK